MRALLIICIALVLGTAAAATMVVTCLPANSCELVVTADPPMASDLNVKVFVPAGTRFTPTFGGAQAFMLSSPDCAAWTIAVGIKGNVAINCVPK